MFGKNTRKSIGINLIAYFITLILKQFESATHDTNSQKINYLLDTKEERKSFFQKILIYIMQTLLGLLTDKETKVKVAKINAEKLD